MRPASASAWTASHVPRPLNARIGLTVSTLMMTGTPRRADRPSWTYCGESMKTASMRPWAARIAAGSSSGIVSMGVPSPTWDAADNETPEGTSGPSPVPPM